MPYRLQDLIDIEQFQMLQDRLNEIYSFPSAIIDNDGNILTATAWQDICTKFHRRNKECEQACIKSDQYILSHLAEANPAVTYHCPHGLVDNATPIVIEGEHLGNYFTGQFFLEEPDLALFKAQAQKYGFDEDAYLEAVKKVPVWTREQLDSYLFFIKGLIEVISGIGLKNLRVIEARQKNEENEKQFQAMFEMASIGIAQADPHTGQWVRINQKMCDITGYAAEEMLSMRVPEITHPEDRERDWMAFQNVVRGAAPNYRIEKRYIRKDGAVVWVNVNMTVIRDDAGRPMRTIATIEDITERKQAEKALRESENNLAAIISATPESAFLIDAQGVVITCNPVSAERLGQQPEELIGRCIFDFLPPEVAVSRRMHVAKVVQTGKPFAFEDVRLGRFLSHHLHPVLDVNGEVKRVAVFGHDITEYKRAEEQLRLQSLVLDQIMDHVTITDLNGVITYVNDAEVQSLGYTREELVGSSTEKYGENPEQGATQREILEETLRNGHWRGEVANRTADGRDLIMDCRTRVVRDAKGQAIALSGIATDITERKQAERELRENEADLREAQFIARMGRWELDLVTNKLLWSDGIFDLFEVNRETFEASYDAFLTSVHPEDRNLVDKAYRVSVEHRTPYEVEHRLLMPDGRVKWVYEIGRTEYNAAGAPVRSVGTIQDITERKQAEEEKVALEAQLRQAQKMESVGRLAGGVAHDFNNMLGVILGHSEMAMDLLDPSQPLHAHLEEIWTAARRSADFTRQLLAFARKQTVAPRVLDLNETVSGMLKMLRRLIGEDIELLWHPSANLWPVKVDPSQVDQILANLCVNARDAIADVGKVTIATENSTFDADYCAAHAGYVPGEYVRLSVSDDGCGMDKETLACIFEPFFTTKGVGEGTGLGLATVYGAVQQNNGFIDAHSEPGRGATFSVYLPKHKSKAGQIPKEGPAEPAVRGSETILLVEDEPAVLRLTAGMLRSQGYTVLAANTPGEAIRLAGEHAGGIHLLMTDVVMPEMNGRDLAKNLLSLHPGLKRLFMSGYTADVIAHHGVLDEGMHFIQKPFSAKKLAEKVREALGP